MAAAPTLRQVEELLAPVLARAGYELVQAALVGGAGGGRNLRLFIDKLVPEPAVAPEPDADADAEAPADQAGAKAPGVAAQGGIDLDDCTRASRLADEALEAAGYNEALDHDSLEVSSPGLERPLTKPAHFVRFVGEPVRLHVVAGALPARQRRLRATLEAADADGITVRAEDGQSASLRYDQLEHAQLVFVGGKSPAATKRAPKKPRGPRAGAKE